jgi:ectoine hydroxylase-related dioxygenase (phytanoyl-CoA dioxygenase family)
MPGARAVVRSLEREGLFRFERLFPLPFLKKARAFVERAHESGALRQRVVRDIAGRYTAVLPFEKPFLEPAFYANPVLSRVLPALLGADYRIGSLEAVIALPGSTSQYQHIDGPIRFDRQAGKARRPFLGDLSALPPYALALATPLCDVYEENGPTALWPGSHRRALEGRLPSEAAIRRQFREARMTGRFGASYLYDYRTFHRGLPNDSRDVRPLLMLVFVRPWYRDPNLSDMKDSVLISPRSLARVPARHRQLFSLSLAARR